MPGHVLVTVGSTKFDQLIRAVDTEAFAAALHEQGYTSLLVQRGDGEYIPHVLVHRGEEKAGLPSGLSVEFVQYLPSMHAYMEAADLIISHAGSGSLFEALSLGKTIIAVPNAILMANHQEELAVHLDRLGHLVSAAPETLVSALRSLDTARLKPYPKGSPQGIADAIHRLMGF